GHTPSTSGCFHLQPPAHKGNRNDRRRGWRPMSRDTALESMRHAEDLTVVTGAGGFIGGNLVKYLRDKGCARIRAVDKKPVGCWYLRTSGAENICLDVS